jgi:hypothetical protein
LMTRAPSRRYRLNAMDGGDGKHGVVLIVYRFRQAHTHRVTGGVSCQVTLCTKPRSRVRLSSSVASRYEVGSGSAGMQRPGELVGLLRVR